MTTRHATVTEAPTPGTGSVRSPSLLFADEPDEEARDNPPFFADLHLDEVVDAIVADREVHDLAPWFRMPLRDVDAVRFRHAVLRDLEQDAVALTVRRFADGMHRMRGQLELMAGLHYRRQRQRWFQAAVSTYCREVSLLRERLDGAEVQSAGVRRLRAYVGEYADSRAFDGLVADTRRVEQDLAAIVYAVRITGNRVRVGPFEDEPDMTGEVRDVFAKFTRSAGEDHRVAFRDAPAMNHVEAQILELVAELNPDAFAGLEEYCRRHGDYVDAVIARCDRELQFYLAYLDYIAPLKAAGLSFAYPRVSSDVKEESASDAFDLALAAKLVGAGGSVVTNDFSLRGDERILVVSGPNNGGKTTFARMFGQLHHLAALGLPVPGAAARLFLADRLFTHFEREEDLANLRSKFEDELIRIRELLAGATGDSVVILNETFGSTAVQDAVLVGTRVMHRLLELGVIGVFVTFVDELAVLTPSTLSMMSTVDAHDPAIQTFRIVRKPADGRAYALALAAKYGLTRSQLHARIVP